MRQRSYTQKKRDLAHLTIGFEEKEITVAVMSLANNKASEPDGIPNEFIKRFWEVIKGDIIQMFNSFYSGQLDLKEINCANVIMIPKKDMATTVGDYRPISVINLISKVISKLLANRLAKELPKMISPF